LNGETRWREKVDNEQKEKRKRKLRVVVVVGGWVVRQFVFKQEKRKKSLFIFIKSETGIEQVETITNNNI
jgi:hypothetical protein